MHAWTYVHEGQQEALHDDKSSAETGAAAHADCLMLR